MKLYDKVKQLLTDNPELRDSDKKLLTKVWKEQGIITNGYFNEALFLRSGISAESVTRARRKVQEHHSDLKGHSEVVKERKVREEKFGMFTFGQEVDYDKYTA